MATNVLPSLSVGNSTPFQGFTAAKKTTSVAETGKVHLSSTSNSKGRPGGGHSQGPGHTGKGEGRAGTHDGSEVSAREKGQKRSTIRHIDPASYRNSILHNICTEMLEKGFHQSFAELFSLVERQRLDHQRAGPAAVLLEPLVEFNHTKLEQLRIQLTATEDARRVGDLDTVYMTQRRLAQYFEQSRDTWLSDHFYQRCLETGVQIRGDGRRKEGEAHCHVGLALEKRGDLHKATGHLEIFYQLARKHKWHTDSGDSLDEIACEHLRRVYTSIAEEVHADNPTDAIMYLKKAHEVSREGGDSHQEGLACYRLGNAYEGISEHETAIQYHKRYLEQCKYHGDNDGAGNAYEALSRSYESKGDIENAVKFLELYVDVAEKAGLQNSLTKACSAIGTMYNTLGNYDKAVEYCGRCYDLCCQLDDKEALHSARVQYGIAKGHQFMNNFSTYVNEPSDNSLQKLVAWKDIRVAPHSEDSEYGGEDGGSTCSDDGGTPGTQGEEGTNIGRTEHNETTISDDQM